jgi:hypothetical protein
MSGELSKVRLYMMRFLYLFTAVAVGINAWPAILNPEAPLDVLTGVAWSFYAAFSILMLLGVWLPERMLPLLFLQLLYKLIWLFGVGLPLQSRGQAGATGAIQTFVAAGLLDLVIIPWPYVYAKSVKAILRSETRRESAQSANHAGGS